jgi:DNA-binding transcriptional regulator YhcF (GntR family)
MAGHNQTGRSKRESNERFVRLPYSVLDSPGYLAASPIARAVHIEVLRLYNGLNNGFIAVSCRVIAERLHVSHTTVSRALKELSNCGLIRMTKASSFSQKRMAAEYRLTHRPCDKTRTHPSKEYIHYGLSSEARREDNQH